MDSETMTHLMDLERRGWDALSRCTGGDFYGQLMTPDALMLLVNGMVLDRDTVADSLDDSPPWTAYELDQEAIVELGEDAAALVYRARASREGEAEPFEALMSSTYRMVDGELRLAMYQQTLITR